MNINDHFTSPFVSALSLSFKKVFSDNGLLVAKVAAIALAIFAAAAAIYYVVKRFIAIKEAPTKNAGIQAPPGFDNYGFSCWVGSAMQVLLACKQFEEIARRPLEKINIQHYSPELGYYEKKARLDTDEEFQKRIDVQTALIELFQVRKIGNPGQLKDALKNLHLKMSGLNLNRLISPPGYAADPIEFLGLLEATLQSHESIWQCNYPQWLFSHECSVDGIKDFRFGIGSTPKIIIARGQLVQFNVNQTHDLTTCFENGGIYRVVGIVKQPPGHAIAYVRQQDRWYCCDDRFDENVKEVKLDSIDLNDIECVVLELCE